VCVSVCEVRAVIKLGRYTHKRRVDNLTECQQRQQQFLPTSEASNTQQSESARDDDQQIEDFISVIVQARHSRLPNTADHVHHCVHQVAIYNQ